MRKKTKPESGTSSQGFEATLLFVPVPTNDQAVDILLQEKKKQKDVATKSLVKKSDQKRCCSRGQRLDLTANDKKLETRKTERERERKER